MSENGVEKLPDIFHLTVSERFVLTSLLPQRSKFARGRVLDAMHKAFRLSKRELEFYEVRTARNARGEDEVHWTDDDAKQKKTREYKIGLTGREIIRKSLQDLQDKPDDESLPLAAISLYEKFMLDLPKRIEEDLVEVATEEGGA